MKAFVNGRFLPTIAVSATALGGLAAATDASAQGGAALPYMDYFGGPSWSLEGSAVRANLSDDKLGTLGSVGGGLGGGGGGSSDGRWEGGLVGAISVRNPIDNMYSWRLSAAWNYFGEEQTHFSLSTTNPPDPPRVTTLDVASRFNFQTIDMDVGRRMDLAPAQLRLFGGLRAMHVGERQHISFSQAGGDPTSDKTGTFDKLGRSHFFGVGPRIGLEGAVPLGPRWAVVGSASAAGIWGWRTSNSHYDINFHDPDPPPTDTIADVFLDRSEFPFIANYGASIGVAYMPWANTTFSAGYRWDAWDNLRYGDDGAHRVIDGFWFKVEVKR